MKLLFTLLSLVAAIPAGADPVASSPLVGKFSQAAEVANGGLTKRECLKAKGRWLGDFCVIKSSNDLLVSQKDGEFEIMVTTSGAKGGCEYSGAASLVAENKLVSKADTVMNKKDEKGEWIEAPAVCEVTVTYKTPNEVEVSSNGYAECREFCAAESLLEIGRALRVRRK